MYLRIAPELYLKRLIVGGLERVYEINRNFRNEGVSTQHNPEFTMLELYLAYADYRELMDWVEKAVRGLADTLYGTQQIHYQGRSYDLAKPFRRVTVEQAIIDNNPGIDPLSLRDLTYLRKRCEQLGIKAGAHDGPGKLQIELFEKTAEATLLEPTFVYAYPAEVSPLSRPNDADAFLADRFEFFLAGREIANGFSELNDPEEQAARFRAQAARKDRGDEEAMFYDADYVRALEYGMPPTAGLGVGIDRLVMFFTDSAVDPRRDPLSAHAAGGLKSLRQCVGERQRLGVDAERPLGRGCFATGGRSDRERGDRQELAAAVGQLHGAHHLECAPVGELAGSAGPERLRRARDEALQTPLEAAAEVRACDHLLSRVAAFVEGDAAEHIEVEHLRDELLRGCRIHLGLSAHHREPLPGRGVSRTRRGREVGPGCRAQGKPAAGLGGDAHDERTLHARHGIQCRGKCCHHGHRCRGRLLLRLVSCDEADDRPARRVVRQLHFRTQDELRQPRRNRAEELARQDGDQISGSELEQTQQRHGAPLRVVIPGEQRVLGPQLLEVVRQLALQEGRRIRAAHAQHAEGVECHV